MKIYFYSARLTIKKCVLVAYISGNFFLIIIIFFNLSGKWTIFS